MKPLQMNRCGNVSQCAPKGPLKRNSDVEITPRSSEGMGKKGMQKSLQTLIP